MHSLGIFLFLKIQICLLPSLMMHILVSVFQCSLFTWDFVFSYSFVLLLSKAHGRIQGGTRVSMVKVIISKFQLFMFSMAYSGDVHDFVIFFISSSLVESTFPPVRCGVQK